MATSSGDSFSRLIPWRGFFREARRSSFLWAFVAGVFLFALLTTGLVLTGLFEHRGNLPAGAGFEHLAPLAGWESADNLPPQVTGGAAISATDSGVLPQLWLSRNRLPGIAASWCYRSSTFFRTNRSALMWLTISLVVFGLVWSLAVMMSARAAARSGDQIADKLRQGVHRQALRLAPSDLGHDDGPEAVDLFVTRAEQLRQDTSAWIAIVTRYSCEIAALVVFVMAIQWRVGMLCLIPLLICIYLVDLVQRRARERIDLARDRAQEEIHLLSEGLLKSRLVRAYGMEEQEHGQFSETLSRYHTKTSDIARRYAGMEATRRAALLLVVGIVLFFVFGDRVLRGENDLSRFPLADSVLVSVCLIWLPFPVSRLLELSRRRAEIDKSAAHIHRYISRIPEVGQAVGAKFLEPLTRMLQFDSVSYSDNGARVLSELDLKIPAGESVSLVSMQAEQARALAYLIPRFIEPESGRVLIDGEDIAWVTLESLRAETVFVGGNQPFFTGSVLNNLTCADSNYSLQEATEAARLTHAHKFILDLPQGYETRIGEHGEQLDSGAAFRLSLARAVLRKPALLIVEEPTAGVDADSKALIDDAYSRICQNRTVIFLPSRLSTIKRSDRVVFISDGRIEATGKQPELLKSSPLYRHWEYTRFNEFRNQQIR